MDLVSGDVLGKKLEENPSFTIYATDEELAELKQCLEEHRTDDLESYAVLMYHIFSIIMTGQMINTMKLRKSCTPSFIN
ncbi:hypothetical protein AKG34_00525 [Peribacillus butanolivorans]|uniref:hypothetical protein n=1 Tax=Peribacillus butanolivorans TaxID=421767 RepID=UPI0006A70465|nr:hypothetical protein [Peribacillus butanolivorans]KON67482.1 hypothetical protein AKG34_00525 [Peribacillus butanolivorans]